MACDSPATFWCNRLPRDRNLPIGSIGNKTYAHVSYISDSRASVSIAADRSMPMSSNRLPARGHNSRFICTTLPDILAVYPNSFCNFQSTTLAFVAQFERVFSPDAELGKNKHLSRLRVDGKMLSSSPHVFYYKPIPSFVLSLHSGRP